MSFKRLRRYPALMAATSTGFLMCLGDLISQKFIEKKQLESINLWRTARFGLVGFCIVGPALSKWYYFMDGRIVMKTPVKTALAKVVADQLIFAPTFLVGFIGLIGALNGHSYPQIRADLGNNYGDILLRNYQLWPAAQLFNFLVVPLQYRVIFVQTIGVMWNTYLSYKTNQSSSGPLVI